MITQRDARSSVGILTALAVAMLLLTLGGPARANDWDDFALGNEAEDADSLDAAMDDVEEDEDEAEEDSNASSGPESSPGPSPQDSSSTTSSQRSGPLSKLRIHGFLTQAYAEADFVEGRLPRPDGSPAGPTGDEVALGIPEEGTFDYRNLALQFRYDISEKDVMVIQFSSRALGDSPISDLEDDVELDWAFYERRLLDNTSLRVGRIQIPIGIFNQIRDVGTILPFYRPSFVFYREGAFTNETVDGLSLAHTFAPLSDWSLEAEVYAGEWDLLEADPFTGGQVFVRVEDSWGFQFWLNTAVPGLRLGLGGQERNHTEGAEGSLRPVGGTTRFSTWYASLDAVFNRWVFRAEFKDNENDPAPFPLFGVDDFEAEFLTYYAQVGVNVTDAFRVYLQYEVGEVESDTVLFTEPSNTTGRQDLGISLNYVFNPNVVFKAEYHDVEGEDGSFAPIFTPQGPRLMPFNVELDNGSYFIVSLSVSF